MLLNYSHDEVGIYSIISWATVFIFLNISVSILTSSVFQNKPNALVFFKILWKTPDSQSSMLMWELSWQRTLRPESSPASLNRSLSGRMVSPSEDNATLKQRYGFAKNNPLEQIKIKFTSKSAFSNFST